MSTSRSALSDLLPRMPRAAWEGWFFIGIGDRSCDVRWHKTHIFRSRTRAGWHPVSALEGIRTPEVVRFAVTADRVYETRAPLAEADLHVGRDELDVAVAGALEWRGAPPSFDLVCHERGGLGMHMEVSTRDRMQWIRAPRLLTYFGLHSGARGTVTFGGEEHPFSGLGILEHAWGAQLPFDPVRLVRGPWHWDVLAFDEEEGAAFAGVSLPLPGLGTRGVRSSARIPGHGFTAFRNYQVDVLARREGVPSRWVGKMQSDRGELRYEAKAATPVLLAAPAVHFLGTEFEATFAGTRYEGRGFTECGPGQ